MGQGGCIKRNKRNGKVPSKETLRNKVVLFFGGV
jgi:hypothetical protein